MNKAIKICLIVYTIIYFLLFILMIVGGIMPLALSSSIVKAMQEQDPKVTAEAVEALIVSLSVSLFFSATFMLFGACVCVVSLAKTKDMSKLGFGSRITLGVFNIVIGSLPSGILLIIQAAKAKHNKTL